MPDNDADFGASFLYEGKRTVFTPEDLTAEARAMGRSMEEFVRREVSSRGEELGLMRGLMREAGRLGLLAAGLPRRYGGLDLPKSTVALLAEKSAGDLSFAITIGVHSGVGALPILLFGTDEQQERYSPGIASGEIIAAFALSEGNSGSDALAAQARAIPVDSGFLLDGTKLWVTNGGFADLFTVFARTPEGFTAFLVPRDSPGLSLSGEEKKMGLWGSSTRRVFLNDVHVPASSIVGEAGQGHRPALYALNAGRFNIAAIALGGAKEALRIAVDYAAVRRQSGRALMEFDLISAKLAEMRLRIYALESMLYRTAGLFDASLASGRGLAETLEEYAVECAILKFFGTETLGHAADGCLQIHGGFGYSEEFPAARLYRDSRVFRIFEGTNEINRLTVVDQIRRRVERGRIPPLSTGTVLTSPPAPRLQKRKMASVHGPVDVLRSVATRALSIAVSPEMPQTALAAAADLAALLYAVESASLRSSKLSTTDAVAVAKYSLSKAVEPMRLVLETAGSTLDERRAALEPLIL